MFRLFEKKFNFEVNFFILRSKNINFEVEFFFSKFFRTFDIFSSLFEKIFEFRNLFFISKCNFFFVSNPNIT